MLYLEQMLLKHNVCEKAQTIKEMPGGMDIYWASRNGANHLVEFLKGVVPVRTTVARKLISQDINSNTMNYKFSMFAEIAPICKVKDTHTTQQRTDKAWLGEVRVRCACMSFVSKLTLFFSFFIFCFFFLMFALYFRTIWSPWSRSSRRCSAACLS